MTRWLLVLLAACAALPDEVAVSTFTSEFDYLGGDDLKGLGSETGQNTGVMVTGTYKLKPTQVQLLPPAGSRAPVADLLASVPEMPKPADITKQAGVEVAEAAFGKAKQQVADATQAVVNIPADWIDDRTARLCWVMVLGTFVICVVWMACQRRRKP